MKNVKIFFSAILFTLLMASITTVQGQWNTSGSNIYYNNGKVSVGTTSPNSLLHLNASSGNPFRVQVSGSTRLFVASNGGTTIGTFADTPPARGLYVYGNLGVGTSTPNAKLHVIGKVEAHELYLDNNTKNARIYVDDEGMKMWTFGDEVTFGTNGPGSDMTLDASGRLHIGSMGSTPDGYRLSVDGNVICEELKVQLSNNGTWPDYVFADDYALTPLEDLEASIKANKHLPGIPSAKEVEEDGISVGEMQRLLVEKVEELTLYVIELNKENELLKKRIVNLEK